MKSNRVIAYKYRSTDLWKGLNTRDSNLPMAFVTIGKLMFRKKKGVVWFVQIMEGTDVNKVTC